MKKFFRSVSSILGRNNFMDGKRMIQYMYERTGDSILDEITKDGIDELLSVFNKFQAQVREIWIELHYNKNTDLT